MHVILGAGGGIGKPLLDELARKKVNVRLVGRNPLSAPGIEAIRADVADPNQTTEAVAGASVVYLLIGLKYNHKVWAEFWPRIMRNTIEACKRANAKLIFFDNVYMYGKVVGPMTEETPFHPTSKKGEVRASIATMLLDEIKSGNLTALIARSADFYGPGAGNGVPNVLVFDKFAKGDKAMWLVNDSLPHSYTFTPDAAKSLVLMTENDFAWNQTWHVPTASNPLTGKQFMRTAAKEMGVEPGFRVLSRPILKIAGLFDSNIRDLYEMLYQYDSSYIFDSSKFEKAFHVEPTPYSESIRITAKSLK